MNNGNNLVTGSTWSSTQAALIVPRPNNPNSYYIFSLESSGRSLSLATVDMTQDGGFGRVMTKNQILEDSSSEKLTGIYHRNSKDIWVITHGLRNDVFHVYLVTAAGVSAAVDQKVGSVHLAPTINLSGIGYMKVSHDSKRLALVVSPCC